MKTTVFLLLCFLSFSASRAQVIDLTGTWTMFEMTYVTDQGNQKMTEDQMKANGSVTDFFFMEEGKFKQTSNMSGSGTLDTYEGTWKLMENKLTLTLKIGEQLMDLVWNVEFKDNVLNLSRTSPDGSLTIINTFRRK
ncbi:MAG: lipocalin family protein [Bacteroidia bacterium]|nr:lipocalin family protein [Bacteroidia bacterium]